MNQFTASIWGDEGWAITLAVKPIVQIIKIVSRDTSPPFYYLLSHFWMKIFGTSELSIRSLTFLFFLGTALTVYLIGKHLWDSKTGLIAGILTLANPFLFNYAFEGRMYSLLALTSTLSVYFFLKKERLGFVLATTAALYTHHFSIFVVFWEGVWRLWETKSLRRFSDFFLIGLLYLPWLYPLYYQTSLVSGGFWLGKPTLKVFGETVVKFLVGGGKEKIRQMALILIIPVLFFRTWFKTKNKSLFLLGWFFAPLGLTYLISRFFQSIFFDRYMLVAIPAATLILASGRRKFSLILILVIIILLTSLNYQYFIHPTKRPFRQLADFIKKEAPGLTLINYSGAAHHIWESKYYGLNAPIYSPTTLPFYVGTALMEKNDIISQLPDEKTLGLITSSPVEEVKIPDYRIIKFQQFGELKFIWLEKL